MRCLPRTPSPFNFARTDNLGDFLRAFGTIAAAHRVGLVTQPERAGNLRRQAIDILGGQARANHRRYTVAIRQCEKSIPIDAA